MAYKNGYSWTNTEFEIQLCTNDKYVISKMHTSFLKFELEEEQIKEHMIQWAKNFGL